MKCVNIKRIAYYVFGNHTIRYTLYEGENVSRETIYGRKPPVLFPVKQLRQLTNQVEYAYGVIHTLTKT